MKELGLKEGSYGTSFQSRLGKNPWLQPYTDATIESLAHKGIKRLAVVTPAFVSDCLETIEKIMSLEGVTPHIYGKRQTRPFRKMGHITIVNEDIYKAREIAAEVKKTIRVISKK